MRTKGFLFLATMAMASASQRSYAGSLTPPGPPAPTTKGLNEVEPRTPISKLPAVITEAGSYYLTGNLVMNATDQDGIIINLDGIAEDHPVSMNLCGFSVIGPGQGQTRGLVVIAQQLPRHIPITIQNGAVTGWGGDGIDFAIGPSCNRIANVRVYNNGGNGLAAGEGAIIREVQASHNGASGIVADSGSILDGCTAAGNGKAGFNIAGIVQPNCLTEAHLQGCVARLNGGSGFLLEAGGLVKDCLAFENGANGFDVRYFTPTLQSCSASSNTLSGFALDGSGNFSVIHCKSSLNGVDGYSVLNNTAHGVFLSAQAFENEQAGFHLGPTVSGIRAFNNSSYGNAWGYRVEGFGNLIIKNSATGNTSANYDDKGQGNSFGPIIRVTDQAPSPWGNVEF